MVSESDQQTQYGTVAAGAGLLAVAVALVTRGAPRWVRIILVLGLFVLASGGGLAAYSYFTQPVTLTVAAGSLDGEAPRMIAAIGSRLAATNARVRLKLVEKLTVVEATAAFAAGETDLAVVRADVGDLTQARAVMVVANAAVLMIAMPDSKIQSMEDLKGKTVGVIGGHINRKTIAVISRAYDLERAKTRFRDFMPAEVGQAVQAKQVQALLMVIPLSDKYIGRIREAILTTKGKVAVLPIELAGAIAAIDKAFESYELPKGTIRGSPPIPDEDLTTLKIPLYLVAGKKVSNDAAGALVQAVFETRRDLIGEHPVLAQIAAPDKDKDAFIPIHPGASAYFEGEQKSFFDKYGDQLFYGSMLLGSLTSLLAAAWRFMVSDNKPPQSRPLTRLLALLEQVRTAHDETELSNAERAIDEILREELGKPGYGDIDAGEAAAMTLATHRLEYLLVQRRAMLRADQARA